jgi:hypothetical protein
MQIEKFLGYEVEKVALPEGLGEAPEYKPIKARGSRGNNHGNGRRGGNNRHRKDHGRKNAEKKACKNINAEASDVKKDKSRRRRSKNKKVSKEDN